MLPRSRRSGGSLEHVDLWAEQERPRLRRAAALAAAVRSRHGTPPHEAPEQRPDLPPPGPGLPRGRRLGGSLGAAVLVGVGQKAGSDDFLAGRRPIEQVVPREVLEHEQVPEEPPQVRVVWPIFESETLAVDEIDSKGLRTAAAERRDGCGTLALPQHLVRVLSRATLETLPWKLPEHEVHERVAQGLEVVTAALLNTFLCVDGAIE